MKPDFAAIRRLLETLETLGPEGQIEAMKCAADAGGGFVKAPDHANSFDSHTTTISLYGAYGDAPDWAEAIRGWSKAAQALLDGEAEARAHEAATLRPRPARPARTVASGFPTIASAGAAGAI